MRKGRLTKKLNLINNSQMWERFSSGDGCWVGVYAYLNAFDKTTYSVRVESNNNRFYFVKHNFKTIDEAFNYGDSSIDYSGQGKLKADSLKEK
jgi:hypothetical protein